MAAFGGITNSLGNSPLLAILLKREDTLVGLILIGREVAERLGIFDEGRLNGLEAIDLRICLLQPTHERASHFCHKAMSV